MKINNPGLPKKQTFNKSSCVIESNWNSTCKISLDTVNSSQSYNYCEYPYSLYTSDDFISFQVCKSTLNHVDSIRIDIDKDSRFIATLAFIADNLFKAEISNYYKVHFLLTKEKNENGWLFSILCVFSETKNALFERENLNKKQYTNSSKYLYYELIKNFLTYENKPPGHYDMSFTYKRKFDFDKKNETELVNYYRLFDEKHYLDSIKFYPLAYFGILNQKLCPVDENGKPYITPKPIDYNLNNKYQKFSITTSIDWGASMGSFIEKIDVGVSSATMKLTAHDSDGKPKESVDLTFTSLGIGLDFDPIEELIAAYIPEDKIKDSFEAAWGAINLSGDIPDDSPQLIEVNFPMSLDDFVGYGWTASARISMYEVKHVSWKFSPSGHRNLGFEFLQYPTNLSPNTFNWKIFAAGVEIKYGFFQTDMSTHKSY